MILINKINWQLPKYHLAGPPPPSSKVWETSFALFWRGGGALQKCTALWLVKLYTTPPSILPLVTWELQSRLAFGQTQHVGWPSGLRPSAITSLQCAALLASGGYNPPSRLIKSLLLLSPARCLIIRPYANSSELSYFTIYPNSCELGTAHRLAVGPLTLGHHNHTACSLACRWRLQTALWADR